MNRKVAYLVVSILLISTLTLAFFTQDSVTDTSIDEETPIVILHLESVRADHIGPCYGYERDTSPNICDIADDGVLFEKAYSQGVATPRAVPTSMTARTPRETGLHWDEDLPEDISTLPELLNSDGYQNYHRLPKQLEQFNLTRETSEDTNLSRIPDLSGDKAFLWLFKAQPSHQPYNPDREFRKWGDPEIHELNPDEINREWRTNDSFLEKTSHENIINLYDGAIHQVDNWVGETVDQLKEQEVYDDAVIVIVSDHGEGFGEHNKYAAHVGKPYQQKIHVPLIIKLPENQHSGTRVESVVRKIDIPHTVLDLAGIDEEIGTVGSSLLPVIEDSDSILTIGTDNDRTVFASRTAKTNWMVQKDGYTYFLQNPHEYCIEGSQPKNEELYYLPDDPVQQENIAVEETNQTESLREELCKIYNTTDGDIYEKPSEDLTEEMKDHLTDLGYLQ